MTIDEARKVAAMFSTADGGCYVCACSLAAIFASEFPEFSFQYDGKAVPPADEYDLNRYKHSLSDPEEDLTVTLATGDA